MEITTFGEKLRKLRELKGLSRKQLASLIGVSEITILRWEQGRTYPNLKELQALTLALEVSEDYLIGRKDILMATNSIESKIKSLPDEAKKELEAVVDYLRIKYLKRSK